MGTGARGYPSRGRMRIVRRVSMVSMATAAFMLAAVTLRPGTAVGVGASDQVAHSEAASGYSGLAWGANHAGQLGDGTTTDRSTPVRVAGTGAVWTQLVAGAVHTAGVKANGALWAWGQNGYGQVGDGTCQGRRSLPMRVSGDGWASVAAGGHHTVAVKADGTLWSWGYNASGQLGIGSRHKACKPIQVGTATDWASVTAGDDHTAAVKRDGTLWSWGFNIFGQLGDGTRSDRLRPVQIGSATDWASVAAAHGHRTVAIKRDGTLWAWGGNYFGELGDGTTTDRWAPVQIGTGTDWAAVATGAHHTVALRTDGTLWAWGWNPDGQIGDGTTTGRLTPAQVGTDGRWATVAAGVTHTVAVKSDGSLWAWGWNGNGQLGDGTTHSQRLTPRQVGADTRWVSVAAGGWSTVALRK